MKNLCVFLSLAAASSATAATVLNYPDFSSTAGLTLNGSAAQAGGNRLRLTPAVNGQSGSAFSTTTVTLTPQASFSTHFTFQITSSGGIGDSDGIGADGLTFVVQTVGNTAGGAGGGIGYIGLTNSVGIEFDTYDNAGAGNDPNGNHIGVNVGGAFNGPTAPIATRMNNGAIWNAWVDYDGLTDNMEVRLSQTSTRPLAATLTRNVDLLAELGTNTAYVGFTSGTGSGNGNHDILSWEFHNDFEPVGVPETGGTWITLGAGLSALILARRLSSRRKS